MELYTENNLILGYINNKHIWNIKQPTRIDKILFNTFDLPDAIEDKENTLTICVDHNFNEQMSDELKNKWNVLFIDHHIQETENNKSYSSNSKMMYDNYEEILNGLKNIIINNIALPINILFHTDLDGVMSAIILKQMINDVINNTISKDNIHFAMLLGELGDLSTEPLPDYLNQYFDNKSDIDTYIKKLKNFSKGFSRFMKAIRTDLLDYQNMPDYTDDIRNEFKSLTNYDFNDIIKFVNEYIYKPIFNCNNFDTKTIILFMNNIAQNKLVQDILDCYNKEAERFINNYIDPNIACTEMNIRFKQYPNTKYKLLIIDSRFDLGRSVLWKYRSDFKKLAVNKPFKSPWYFKATDYYETTELYQITKGNYDSINATNIVVYNSQLKKLTIDGENAYNISKEVFDGGGHMEGNDADNTSSIGSVVLDYGEEELFNEIIIENIR